MNKINYHVLMNSIVVNYEGKTISINKGDRRYLPIIEAIKDDKLGDIPEIVDNKLKFSKHGFEVVDGNIVIDGQTLPKALSDRVLAFMEDGLLFQPILNLWDRLKKNPSFNSRKMLYDFLEHNGHPITEDGCFIAYRGVTDDFKDPHTRTFDNSVGSVCEMPREEVDDNPDNTCSAGLHVACYDYANGFGHRTIEVKVDPVDVVCVPRDYNGTKMRTCKFEVVAVCENINSDNLYGQEAVKQEQINTAMEDLFDDSEDYEDDLDFYDSYNDSY